MPASVIPAQDRIRHSGASRNPENAAWTPAFAGVTMGTIPLGGMTMGTIRLGGMTMGMIPLALTWRKT